MFPQENSTGSEAAHPAQNTIIGGIDLDLTRVVRALYQADPEGRRTANVLRVTYDQLYNGQHTGRYSWDQLFKTEKTHFGTLLEINLRREFTDILDDGAVLDFKVEGTEIDCKFSQTAGGWMLPPECFGELLLVCTASDTVGTWSLGVVRASAENLRSSVNRDGKTGLNQAGRASIEWLHRDANLPPNILLGLHPDELASIFASTSGQQRLDELFRRVTQKRIGRNTVATVARQDDYMKRVRTNGGSRSRLAPEGYIIPSGDYQAHRMVAAALRVEVPEPGEFVSIRLAPAHSGDYPAVLLDGAYWRLARMGECTSAAAPSLPETRAR